MQLRSIRTRLAACGISAVLLGAAAPPDPSISDPPPRRAGHFVATGAYGAYLNGRFAAHAGDQEIAAEALLRALATDAQNPELLQTAFMANILAGRADAVRLARLLPGMVAAQLLLLNQDIKAGKWDAAETRIRGLPRQTLTQALQPLLSAWSQVGANRMDAALSTLRPMLDSRRMRGVFALHTALINDIAGHNAEAARYYQQVQAEGGGNNLRMAQILASWQMRQGRLTEATQILRDLADTGQELPVTVSTLLAAANRRPVRTAAEGIAEVYLGLAASLSQSEPGDTPRLFLRLALDLRPDFTTARLMMADLADADKQTDNAARILADIAADDPLIGIVRLRRATIAEHAGHTDDALRDLEQLGRDYPDSSLPYATMADIMRQKRRFVEAVPAYDKAIARISAPRRGSWSLFYARGIAHDRAHDWPKAEADFKRALELSGNQPYILNYLGYSWADQGVKLTEARGLIEKAMALKPNDGAITDSLGWVLFRQGDIAGAIKHLERAAELQPEDATINSHLGDAYWAAGRTREAQFQWRRALLFNPEPEEKNRLEAKLQSDPAPPSGENNSAQRSVQ